MNISLISGSFPRFFVFLIFLLRLLLPPLFSQENNLHPRAPIAIATSVDLTSIAPKTPEENIIGATAAALFAPVFLGQDSKFIISTPMKCCTSNRSDHEYGNEYAFAGILENGSIYAWGDETHGGQSPTLPRHQDGTPKKAKSIISNQTSFVATLDDNSLWEWGFLECASILEMNYTYATSKEVKLPTGKKVGCCLASTASAFAAILDDSTLYAWGQDLSAGKAPSLPKNETGTTKKPCSLYSNDGTFTAIFPDKTLLAWGNLENGGEHDSKTISLPLGKKLQSCCSLAATRDAFASILEDDTIFVWGQSARLFQAPKLPAGKKPIFITASNNDFTLLLEDGDQNQSFLSWGLNFSYQKTKLPAGRKIKADCCVVATEYAFATILDNGAIFAWGNPSYGGSFLDQPKSRSGHLIEACCLAANDGSFSAILQDGSIVTWGNYWYGGTYWYNHGNIFPPEEEYGVYASSTKACCLVANHAAFSATVNDGSLLAWGSYRYGGNLWQEDISGNQHGVGVKLLAKFISPTGGANVLSLVSNGSAFAAVTDVGSLLKWGASSFGGGNSEEIQPKDLPEHQKLMMIASPLKKDVYHDQDELAGLAIVSNVASSEQGKWQFLFPSTNEWITIPKDLSETKALTLSSEVKLRFLPAPDFIGDADPLSIKLLDVKAKIVTGAFIDTTLETYSDSCSVNTVDLKTTIKVPSSDKAETILPLR